MMELLLLLSCCILQSKAFVHLDLLTKQPISQASPTSSISAGKGFGKSDDERNDKEPLKKSYGKSALSPNKNVIDEEGAMEFFFESNEEWKPLFSTIMADTPDVAASDYVKKSEASDAFEFNENTSPWKRLEGIPTDESDREVLAGFLDSMQQSLIEIPVDERTKDDENDLHFLEEGRRMLVCSRFHVVTGVGKGAIEKHDSLFSTCWNEITQLVQEDESDTGSLIVVPECEMNDLSLFADMNVQRPLQWLGIDHKFEVVSVHHGRPAIRLIHKLSDMAVDNPNNKAETM
ncbi:unnamed protein product [Cylindrotheca closterium]|uniref:Uncharacterized protein n=1 Tax=Cylindrotheca closterium TaxID=2856 RepID=A0AAD2CGZ6_9STRA|nr:unnamed protein product [Cylindrotheca closterium]